MVALREANSHHKGIPFDAHVLNCKRTKMERVKGIEPSLQPWQGRGLPLHHTRKIQKLTDKA